jgi:uncharacterized protein (TIGR00730 family)
LRRICVFAGSKHGVRAAYADAARTLGVLLARRRIGIVYGGGQVGLMGVLADAALQAGGEVIGIIPGALATEELAHPALSELRVVASMHERKALMTELGDGFLALPGGFGTFEELFETITWAQLGLHAKPFGLVNTEGYFDPLLRMVGHAVAEGFIHARHRDIILCDREPAKLLDALLAYRPPPPRPQPRIREDET